MKKILLLSLFIISFINSHAYYSLTVNNPQRWGNDIGTIEEATVSIHPKGMYVEYGVYMTLSAKNAYLDYGSENLEINYQFELPEKALVIDSWLWVDDVIIKADIRDAKSANTIYEGIVNRRKDPSILTKINATQYLLKVYPLIAGKSRKIKITYLLPALWNANKISAEVPTQLFRNSNVALGKLNILFNGNKEYNNPILKGSIDKSFANIPENSISISSLNSQEIKNPYTLEYNFSNIKSIYLSTYTSPEGTGYYELAIDPLKNLGLTTSKKVALLIDYENGTGDIFKADLIDKIKSYMSSNFADKDSFNVIYNKVKILKASEIWMSANSANIDRVFKMLKESSISSYSSLPELMTKGIDFVNTKKTGGSLLLISNNKSFNNEIKANELLSDIKSQMKPIIETSIIDISSANYEYSYYVNNISYKRNEYFFKSLAAYSKGVSQGNYQTYQSLDEIFKGVFSNLDTKITNFELYTSLKNGTCYDRTIVSEMINSQTISASNYILQTGKFEGDLPMEIKLSGKVDAKLYTKSFSILPDNDKNQTTMLSSIGNDILGMEKSINYYNGQYIKHDEITKLSLANRILSIYTAFLALEPSDSVFACKDCVDETKPITGTDDMDIADSTTIDVFPNPFADMSTITIKLPKNTTVSDVSVQISDMIGKPVKSIDINSLTSARATEFTWNGTDNAGADLPNGTYFIVLNTGKKSIAKKIVLRK